MSVPWRYVTSPVPSYSLYWPGVYELCFANLRWFWNQLETCRVNNSCNTRNARCIKFSHFPQFPQKIVTCYFKVSHVVGITTNHHMQEVIVTALLSVNQSKKVKEWTNDQVHRFTMMKLIHLLVSLLLTYGVPHTNIIAMQEQLKSLRILGDFF